MKFKVTFLFTIVLLFSLGSCDKAQKAAPLFHPADFAPSASTCFVWSADFYEIVPELVSVISAKDKVTLYIGEHKNDTTGMHSMLKKYGCNFQNIQFVKLNQKPENVWIRDYGPVYLINNSGERKIVNFKYFGKYQTLSKEIAAKQNIPLIQSTLNSTGGAREVNGKGTIILCETHELDVNKPKTKEQIENEIITNLKLKKVIWLKQGIPQDDNQLNGPLFNQIYPNGVNGHVDEFCRFVNAETILISSITEDEAKRHPIMTEAKKRLDENYEILIHSTDQNGKKFNIIKVPFAPLFVVDNSTGDSKKYVTPVTSYLNFIVTNSFVIMPSYLGKNNNRQDYQTKENKVEQTFKKVFPSKEIIKIPATDLNYFSGGFHCISINEPMVEK